MIKMDFHVHSTFCDGKNTPEELVLTAIEKGIKHFGILAHSYTDFDTLGTLHEKFYDKFISEINTLKEKYEDKITLYVGIEQDMFTKTKPVGFDYIIGSMHFVKYNGAYHCIDHNEKCFVETVNNVFGGDFCKVYELYYEQIAQIVDITNANIIGHFDIITKYNRNDKYFDTTSERYKTAYKKAVDVLAKKGAYFEVNTGMIARGHKDFPSPNKEICDYIRERGGKLILSSDTHQKQNLAFEFEKWAKEYSI